MVESGNSRVWRTIPIILIMVLFCPIANSQVIYVDDDAAGANDGTSWENAYNYLQDVLADAKWAEKPVEIRVAQGVQKPDHGRVHELGDKNASFELINGVTIKGGYAGIGHADPNDRDVAGFVTSDLEGEWFLSSSCFHSCHTLDRLLFVNNNGVVTGGTFSHSDELVDWSITGKLLLSNTGRVTGRITNSDGVTTQLTMQMDKDKGLIAGEGNVLPYKQNDTYVFIRKASGFVTSDLEGEWFMSGSNIQGQQMFDGLIIINSAGKVTGGTHESSDGAVYTFEGGGLAIDETGKVTGEIENSNGVTTQITMQMKRDTEIIAGEGNTDITDEGGMLIFIKRSLEFKTNNLEGEWFLTGSIQQGNHMRDGLLSIDNSGGVVGGKLEKSEGITYTFVDGNLVINETGEVTGWITDSSGVTALLAMQMDNSKYVVAGEVSVGTDSGASVLVRRPPRYKSILSGDLLGNDDVVDDPCDVKSSTNRSDNSFRVVYGNRVDSSSILDGFTITGGKGLEGGGIYLSSHSEPTVSNCRFYANSAYRGGAIAISNVGKPTISNCMFISNSTTTIGGAIYADDRGSAIVTNCIFIDNYAPSDGGAVYMSQICRQVYTDCMFLRNKAGAGGAIVDRYANVTTYVRCSFIENSATTSGGAYHLGSLREENFTDCSFVRNESNHSGGGVTIWGGKANFTRCIFHENTSSNGGGLHFTSCMYRSTIEDCEFIKNTTSAL